MLVQQPYEKAAEEAAKAAQQLTPVVDKALTRLSAFLYTVLGKGAEHLGTAFSDWAATFRYQNALKLADRVEEIHRQRRLAGKTISIAPRVGIPLLERAVLEDDETLAGMWAGLIANAMDPARHLEARRSFIDLLSALEPLDALVLREIRRHAMSYPDRKSFRVETPENVWRPQWPNMDSISSSLMTTKELVAFSLENIERLGLAYDYISEALQSNMVPITDSRATIDLTNTGRALLVACSI